MLDEAYDPLGLWLVEVARVAVVRAEVRHRHEAVERTACWLESLVPPYQVVHIVQQCLHRHQGQCLGMQLRLRLGL
jgi:hypothetical protein